MSIPPESPELTDLIRKSASISDGALRAAFSEWPTSAEVARFVAAEQAPATGNRSRRRRRTVALVLAAAITVGGATWAAASRWSAHTGIFGSPGATENDTSEWLDMSAPDFPAVARELAKGIGIPFPPGDSAESYIPRTAQTKGFVQSTGVEVGFARAARCAWSGYWLQARTLGDAAALEEATAKLGEIPSWPLIKKHADSSVIEGDQRRAASAAAGDPTLVEKFWNVNCLELPRAWERR